MTNEEVIKELVQIAGRPTEEPPAEKVAEEDDCEYILNNIYVALFSVDVSCKEHNRVHLAKIMKKQIMTMKKII